MIYFLGSVLEVIEELRPFARRSVSIWVNYLQDILIAHCFLSVILVALCVTLFLLINSLNFRICLFFVNYTNFHESFLQDGTPEVLQILKDYTWSQCWVSKESIWSTKWFTIFTRKNENYTKLFPKMYKTCI